ncbi:hypothetical protein OBG91_00675 [Lactococcus lactis]|nr:hypothetical protein [Lactococcus lactis]
MKNTKRFVLNYDNDRPEDLEAPEYFTQLVDGVLDKKKIWKQMFLNIWQKLGHFHV